MARSSADRIATLPRRVAGLARSVWDHKVERGRPLSGDEFVVRLSGHTAVQNGIALTLGAATLVGLVGISAGFAPNAVGVAGLPPDKQPTPRPEEKIPIEEDPPGARVQSDTDG
jgi:hypothetical protein